MGKVDVGDAGDRDVVVDDGYCSGKGRLGQVFVVQSRQCLIFACRLSVNDHVCTLSPPYCARSSFLGYP